MKESRMDMDRIDHIIETSLVDKNFTVSEGFVDRVMGSIDGIKPTKSYWKYMINVAAFLALVFSIGNITLMLNQVDQKAENQIVEDWANTYEVQNNELWTNYFDIELLASNENIK